MGAVVDTRKVKLKLSFRIARYLIIYLAPLHRN